MMLAIVLTLIGFLVLTDVAELPKLARERRPGL